MEQHARVLFFTQAYNAQATLRRAMDSVLTQSYDNIAYYILDNASTDGTGEIIREYAAKDKRVVALSRKTNDIYAASRIVIPKLLRSFDYYCRIDADDEYVPGFLKEMVELADAERLDIVIGGFDRVDGATGQLITRRALGENMILEGAGFADEFMRYRRYAMGLWAKLYSTELMIKSRRWSLPHHPGYYEQDDTVIFLHTLKRAARAGVYGQPVYNYYQYPSSLIHTFSPTRPKSDAILFHEVRKYLEHYGPVSKLNMDYLYAIYMGDIEYTLGLIYQTDKISFEEKLNYIRKIFKNRITRDMLRRDADPQFNNLAGRDEFCVGVQNWIRSERPQEHARLADEVIMCIEAAK